jgi:hypothetical protein
MPYQKNQISHRDFIDLKMTDFICLHRGGSEESILVPFKLYGGSSNIEDEERSAVERSLMVNAWPPKKSCKSYLFKFVSKVGGIPIASADPGRTLAVVTPPDIVSLYASS